MPAYPFIIYQTEEFVNPIRVNPSVFLCLIVRSYSPNIRYREQWFREEECNCLKEIVEEYNYLNSKAPYTLVLALGGGMIGKNMAIDILETFLNTEFSEGENHIRRIGLIE